MKWKTMRHEISDDELLAAVATRNSVMTYVVRNILSTNRAYLGTPQILRQLKRLEREGKVERVPSSYTRQLCWAIPSATQVAEAE